MLLRAGVDWLDDNDLSKKVLVSNSICYLDTIRAQMWVSYLLSSISASCDDGYTANLENCSWSVSDS